MLNVAVLSGGKAKSSTEHALALDYLAKARDHGRQLGFAGFALTEYDERKVSSALAVAPYPVLLDETGNQQSSRAFAQWLAALRDQGLPRMTFVIGPADGFTAQDRGFAKATLGFGPQTWPHLLVRTMLAEQLFRAMTILGGHPYHRD
jgi:23S rRNA (pseudouridine1915-N3)-methyltransferase